MVEENAEELSMFGFNISADFWKELPWDKVEFKAESLTRGSTILNFSITFKQPPRNPNDVCAYTVIELLIKTTIENLNFIDRIEEKSSSVRDDNRMMLHARFKVDKENFLTDKVDDILKKLRETIKMISEDSSSESADISPETALENPLRELSLNNFISAANLEKEVEVQKVINQMRKRGGPVADWLIKLTPCSIRDIVRESLGMVDNAEITVNIERAETIKFRTETKIIWNETYMLFPFDSRKLKDLSDDMFDQISMHLTDELPKEGQIWVKLIRQLFSCRDALKLEKDIKREQLFNPYTGILCEYQTRGNTLGQLLQGLRIFSESEKCTSHKEVIDKYITNVECLREKLYNEILEKLDYSSKWITAQEFDSYYRKYGLRAKTQVTHSLNDLKGHLTIGAMLWMMRKGGLKQKLLHKSYAHVGIISDTNHLVHVTEGSGWDTARSIAVIKEDHLDNLENVEMCFLVLPPDLPSASIYQKRAKACKGFRLNYVAATAQCETFCQYVHGNWDGNIQIPTGVAQNGLNMWNRGFKFIQRKPKSLKHQMIEKFTDLELTLPEEIFPSADE